MAKLLQEEYMNRMLLLAEAKKPILKEDVSDTNSVLNGMDNARARKLVGNVARKAYHTGLYKDEYWEGVKQIYHALDNAGIDYDLDKSEYSPEFPNTWKKWYLSFKFINNKGRETILNGIIIASGAGSVEQPLDRYDMNFTVY